MSSVEFWFSSSEDEEDFANSRELAMKRRKLRDYSNPLEMPANTFIKYMRISKENFMFLLRKIETKLTPNRRSTSIPPIIKLTAALRFFAEGGFQKGVGNDFLVSMSQSTVSKILDEILSVLEDNICEDLIKFPNETSRNEVKLHFFRKFGFPGVIGCVDGTHVRIVRPSNNVQHLYYNRKGFHSLNVMLVCDHEARITYVDANNPGASHDSFVWSISRLDSYLQNNYSSGDRNSWLLGDAGYTLKPYVMTPFRTVRSEDRRESRYNTIHSRARITIERTIGILKNTFRCLLNSRQIHYSPEKTIKIVNVCCALHNLRINSNIPFSEEEIPFETEEGDDVEVFESQHAENEASTIRENILNSLD